jgi:hypothetical protein
MAVALSCCAWSFSRQANFQPVAARGIAMRPVLATLLFCSAAWLVETAHAEPHWCANTSEGSSNCSYISMEQCRASVSGTGGSCIPEAPVGHLQPRAANAKPAARDEKLDALLERVNRKNDKLILCRGC